MFNQFPYLVVSPMPTVYLRKKIYLSNTGKTKTLNSYDLINQNEILLVVKQDSTKVINQEVGLLRELFVAIGQRPRSRVCLVIGPKRCFYIFLKMVNSNSQLNLPLVATASAADFEIERN